MCVEIKIRDVKTGSIMTYKRPKNDLETINKIIDDWNYEGFRDCIYEVI